MGNELKTLKEIRIPKLIDKNKIASRIELKQEGKKIVRNLQSEDSIYPDILNSFPDEMKGEIAKDLWNNTKFRYGAEYGMMAMLMYFLNIEKENIYEK